MSPTTDSHGWHETCPELQFLCSWAPNFILLSFSGLAFTATSIVATTSTTTCQTRRWDKYPKAASGFEAWQPLRFLWFVRNGRDYELHSEKTMQHGTISVPNFHGLADPNISARQKHESHRNPKMQEKVPCYSTNSWLTETCCFYKHSTGAIRTHRPQSKRNNLGLNGCEVQIT